MNAQTIPVRVVRKEIETEDICGFELTSLDGSSLTAFSAGAHIDVHLDGGMVRQYSLCNSPHERHRYRIGVLREAASRGGSLEMHALEVGSVLQISEPKNHFPLLPAKRSLLFAGGIGVAPMLAMAASLAESGGAFNMPFELHYCARAPERAAFRRYIAESAFAEQVHFHYDNGDAAQKLDLTTLLATPDPDTHLYVCGPAGFIEHVLDSAKEGGWPAQQIHREYFGANFGTNLGTNVGATAFDIGGDHAFEVKFASSGKVIAIPAGRTVFSVLAEHGVDIPVSCEQGVCGTCLTRVLDGVPDHRDLYLTDEERAANDQFTPCCSRAESPALLLDL